MEIGLDLTNTEEWGGGFEAIPAGEYRVYVNSAELLEGRTSGDPYLKVTYVVTDGDYTNRRLFDNFSLWSTRTKVPQQRFKSLRRAVGLNPNVGGDSDELIDREFIARVTRKERSDQPGVYENSISGYKAIAVPQTAVPAPAPAPKAAPSSRRPARASAPVEASEDGGARMPW